MNDNKTIHLHTVSELGHLLGDEVLHPLVHVIDFARLGAYDIPKVRIQCDFYIVMFKRNCPDTLKWGRQPYDFQKGSLVCISSKQIIDFEPSPDGAAGNSEGWALFFHPDFIRGTSLASRMKEYTFFSYNETEALHLSEKERTKLGDIIGEIETELQENMDEYSQTLILTNIELLLNYCMRYYGRQFITRKPFNRTVVSKAEAIIREYLDGDNGKERGFLSASALAQRLNLSPDYLSDLLRKEIGMNAKDFIHHHLIEEAKHLLLTTDQTVSEICYSLGFEYPQYFTRLFKSKTGQTPQEYRHSN